MHSYKVFALIILSFSRIHAMQEQSLSSLLQEAEDLHSQILINQEKKPGLAFSSTFHTKKRKQETEEHTQLLQKNTNTFIELMDTIKLIVQKEAISTQEAKRIEKLEDFKLYLQ